MTTDNPLAKPEVHATTHTYIDLDHDRDLGHDLHPDFDPDLGDDLDPNVDFYPGFDLELDLAFRNDLELDLRKLILQIKDL